MHTWCGVGWMERWGWLVRWQRTVAWLPHLLITMKVHAHLGPCFHPPTSTGIMPQPLRGEFKVKLDRWCRQRYRLRFYLLHYIIIVTTSAECVRNEWWQEVRHCILCLTERLESGYHSQEQEGPMKDSSLHANPPTFTALLLCVCTYSSHTGLVFFMGRFSCHDGRGKQLTRVMCNNKPSMA